MTSSSRHYMRAVCSVKSGEQTKLFDGFVSPVSNSSIPARMASDSPGGIATSRLLQSAGAGGR